MLFNILQDGGREAHSFISATDNDFKPYFEKLCLFATLHLFDFAQDILNISCPWEDKKELIKSVIENDDEDDSFKSNYLDIVFGEQSKLDYEAWCKAVCSDKVNYIFNSRDLRIKLFEKAGIKYELTKI